MTLNQRAAGKTGMADEAIARHSRAEFSIERALELHREGRLDEAEQIYSGIVATAPGDFQALHLSGLLAYQQGRLADALRLVAAALKARPAAAEALMDHGAILDALGRPDEALAGYDRLLPSHADDARLHYNRGNAQKRLGRYPDALASYDRALALAPGLVAAHQNRGATLAELDRDEEALGSLEQALALAPDLPQRVQALDNTGKILSRLKRYDVALATYDRLLAICPDHADGLLRSGVVLAVLGRYDEAIARYDEALRVAPGVADAHLFRGNALIAMNRVDEALRAFCAAGAVDPHYATPKFNEGLVRLCLGDFRAGWAKYEYRWGTEEYAALRPVYPRPQWRGERDVAGKTILLCAEQGMGDAIQFVRYAPLVAALGAKVLLGVHAPLTGLLASVAGVSQVIADGGTLPHFDLYIPLLSLPLAFGTELATIPARVPYVRADAARIAKWRERMPQNGRLRIGICWAGTNAHPNNRNCSIPLARFSRILSVSGLDFVSLQKDITDADAAILSGHGVTNFADEFEDFSDTAAVLAMLDLIVTVDTSVAHLAGAMGKAVAVLIPFAPDFRWMLRAHRQPVVSDHAAISPSCDRRLGHAARTLAPRARRGGVSTGRFTPMTKSAAKSMKKATSLWGRGRLGEAARICEAVLAADPQHFDALHLSGVVKHQLGRSADGLRLVAAALKAKPGSAEALMNYGVILDAVKRHDEALASFDCAVALQADNATLLCNRANTLKSLGRYEEALASYDRAIELQPDLVVAHNNRGTVLAALDRYEDALAGYDRLLALAPQRAGSDPLVLNNRGTALTKLKRHDEALASLDRALALKPDYADAHSNRGAALTAVGRCEEALESFARALSLKPDFAAAHLNRGNAYLALNRMEEALASFSAAIALEPENAEANFTAALTRLCVGDFRQGWKQYEYRWKRKNFGTLLRDCPKPIWRGDEDLQGKTIFLMAEQGMGDAIQFVRYAPLIAARGAKVLLGVHRPLAELMTCVPGVSEVIASGGTVPEFDFYCPLLGLPLAFGTELGDHTGRHSLYPAAAARTPPNGAAVCRTITGCALEFVGPAPRRIMNDRNRSMTLDRFAAIVLGGGARFHQPAKRCQRHRLGSAGQARRHRTRPGTPGFRRHRGGDGDARSDRQRRHLGGASGRRMGKAVCRLDPIRAGFPLAARSHRQPLVSDHAAVPAKRDRRLGNAARSLAAGAQRCRAAPGATALMAARR